MPLIRMIKSVVDKLEPSNKEATFWDEGLKGFGLKVTSKGAKTFIVVTRINGKQIKVTLGRYGAITCEQARTLAQEKLGQVAQGIDPNQVKKQKMFEALTFRDVYADYLKVRTLKPNTLRDYEYLLKISELGDKPWTSISRDIVLKKHKLLSSTVGPRKANACFEFIRALINYATEAYRSKSDAPLILENPVKALSFTKAWNKISPRTDHTAEHQLSEWWRASGLLRNPITCDYLRFTLLTGLRREEAACLPWKDVDFKARTIVIPDPKNGIEHVFPLSDYLLSMLERLYTTRKNDFVFFSEASKTGHLVEPKRGYKRIEQLTGIKCTVHGLRRSFASFGSGLDVNPYTLKRLMNHKTNDITGLYIQHNIEKLRVDVQKVTDFVLKKVEVKESAEVIELFDSSKKSQNNKLI